VQISSNFAGSYTPCIHFTVTWYCYRLVCI